MKPSRDCMMITVMLITAASLVPSLAQEKKIAKKDLPPSVLGAFQKAYPHATIRGTAMEEENGRTYYEIESTDGKTSRDLLYRSDGTVAEIEETVATTSLPAPVKSSVAKELPEGKIEKAETVTKGAAVTYEIKLSGGSIVLDPSGKVLKKTTGKAQKGKTEKEEKED